MKNKVLMALLSFLIATALWLYVVTVVSPGSEVSFRDIPVSFLNENVLTERGLMVTSYTQTASLTLSGNRTDLNKLSASSMSVTANLSAITSEGTYQLSYSPAFPSGISGSSINVLKRDPEYITVNVEARKTKSVPVEPEIIGEVPEGFLVDKENPELDYTHIELTGPASVVDLVEKATITVDIAGCTETVTGDYVYTLCNIDGEPVDVERIVTNAEAVNCVVRILRVGEVTLTVKTVYGGGATQQNTTVTVSPETIRIAGSDTLVNGLDFLEVGVIDLATVTEDAEMTFEIALPEGVRNLSNIGEVTVSVQFRDLYTKSLKISEIDYTNVPEGMTVEIITQELFVTVRGPQELVEAVEEKDLRAVIDLTGAQAGTAPTKAIITVDSAYEEVGAVGEYSVTYTLK